MILFLDFDGVLHPKGAGGAASHFSRKAMLEELLLHQSCSKVQVVVSSTWREAYSLQKLREVFCSELRSRIIGSTPVLDDLDSDHLRYREIQSWLNKNPSARRWCAVDDDREGFPPSAKLPIVITDGSKGLTAENIAALRLLIAQAENLG